MSDPRRCVAAVALLAALAAGSSACGGGSGSPVERGEAVATDVGCMSCHATGAEDRLGPGWGGIWGEERELADGSTVVVDEAYLRRAILAPDSEVVAGWTPIMPAIALSDAELEDVVAYLREVTGG